MRRPNQPTVEHPTVSEQHRFARQVRLKSFEVLNEKKCGWCFKPFTLDKLKTVKRSNGKKASICVTCHEGRKKK